jgi:hypothetical protein
MIVQISLVRNELQLIKEMLPLWKRYCDGFVFMLDRNTDETEQYLQSVKHEYNILEVLNSNVSETGLSIETNMRQRLFDAGRKYSNKIICLDADEYLDGVLTKLELEELLDSNVDTVFHLQWVQYTSVNTIRVDGPWRENYKDRIGSYVNDCQFAYAQNHSTHLPYPQKQSVISPDKLFVAHLQWLNKTYVAIKQYFWKVFDYVNNLQYNVPVVGSSAYDASINNFEWEEEYTFTLLKVSPWLFDELAVHNNYRLSIIKKHTKQYNIPDLGSWGYDFLAMDETLPHSGNRFKVSVITAIGKLATYEKYIPRWFENAQDQHLYEQTEHIIVYKEWSEHFHVFKKLSNFTLIHQEDTGMYNAWNLGISNATTKYITNWNIDDLRHPINTKIKFDLLEKNDHIAMVHNWYVATTDENETFYNLDMSSKSYLAFPDDYHTKVLENCYAGPDPMWRKSLHDTVGYFDNENFATIGDWEMWIRFAKYGAKFKLIPEILCIYLDHDNTISKKQADKVALEKNNLIQKYGYAL